MVAAGAGAVTLVAAGAGTAVATIARSRAFRSQRLTRRLLRPGDAGQLCRAGRDIHRSCFDAGHSGQFLDLATLIGQNDCDDGALFACAGRATCAVQVVLVIGRRIDVDDEIDSVDVDSTGGDISCNENRCAAVLESLQDPGALVLSFAAVQRLCSDTEGA